MRIHGNRVRQAKIGSQGLSFHYLNGYGWVYTARTNIAVSPTQGQAMILHALIVMVAGWLQRHQQQVITYLIEENRVLTAQLGGRRLRLMDMERCRLAALAHPLGRKRLKEVATLATPDTLLRWYKRLIAQKFGGSAQRRQPGRPRVAEEVEQLVVRMA